MDKVSEKQSAAVFAIAIFGFAAVQGETDTTGSILLRDGNYNTCIIDRKEIAKEVKNHILNTGEDFNVPLRVAKRRRLVNDVDGTYRNDSNVDGTPRSVDGTYHPDRIDQSGSLHDTEVLVISPLEVIDNVLPQELADAIVRTVHPLDRNFQISDLSMNIPVDSTTCNFSMGISFEKAPYLIQELFKVRLEIKLGLRYISLPGGLEVLPDPKFTLRQCSPNAIPLVFGPRITEAIQQSPVYLEDKAERRRRTRSVWANISANAGEKINVNLSLGLVHGTMIAEELFPREYRY
ncbi:hypothetical protein F5Y06DRAFT_305446 [Hypoxylon sp. FL0890]|nr:hypothetical protein F5Y06DRAFT_305446 [Hypoxylon sp. FL0890]